MRTNLLWALAVSLTAAAASAPPGAGLPPTGNPPEEVELRLWNVPDRRAVNVVAKADLVVYDEFFRRNRDIRLSKQTGIRLTGEMADSTKLMAIAGGTAPDVMQLFFREAQTYIRQDFLYPLDEFLTPEWVAARHVAPQAWEVVRRGGSYYGVIFDYSVMGLAYRRDLFREAALPDAPPADWEELYRYAQRLTLPGKKLRGARTREGQYGLALRTGQGAGWVWTNFVWQAGGDMIHQVKACPECGTSVEAPKETVLARCPGCNADISEQPPAWKAVYDSAEGIAALEFYRRLRWSPWAKCPTCGEPYDLQPGAAGVCPACGAPRDGAEPVIGVLHPAPEADLEAMLAEGQVAMIISVPRPYLFQVLLHSGLTPSQIGFGSLPAGPPPKGRRANLISGEVRAINATQPDPRVREAAWRFLEFACSDEANRLRTRVYVDEGWASLVRPALLEQFGYLDELREIPADLVKAYTEIEKWGRVEPSCEGYLTVQTTELAVPIDKVLTDPSADPAELLHRSARNVNTYVLGSLTEQEMRPRRMVGLLVLIAVGTACIIAVGRGLLAHSAQLRAGGIRARSLRVHARLWVFILPAFLSVLVWQYVPLGRGAVMAFYDYRLVAPSTWVGIDNFIQAFSNPFFYQVVIQTLYYVALSLGLGFVAPIVLAILLAEVPRGKMFFRTIYYLPAVMTGLVIMFLWKWFYEPTSAGILNRLIGLLGIGPQAWLQDPRLAMVCLIIPCVWAGAGPGSLIYLAALKTVGTELYEAADIDGAGVLRKVWSITLPKLKPLVIMNFVGAFAGAFHASQNILVMTEGGPANATRVLGLEIFFNAFLYLQFGYATALAWIMGAMLIGFTVYQLRILRKVEFKATEVETV